MYLCSINHLEKDMNLNDILNAVKTDELVFIRFHASWCGVCKLIAPFVDRLKGDERFSTVTFIDVDVEENLDVKEAFKINNLPYFATFKSGKLREEYSTSKKDQLEMSLTNLVS
jgi:thiol-disulfide isomerase/thioredoxin